MVRVDVWDLQKARDLPRMQLGYDTNFDDRFTWGDQLGKGGFGVVRVVHERTTGKEFACKSIRKSLQIHNLSPDKLAAHLANIKREVAVLHRLRGTLNVTRFECAYEDTEHVHIVMELNKGGELHHRIGRRHYSEKTVASYLRAVLRTIAQCHSHHILHRDIKPGNFMLLTDADDSPLKAVDFGLAVFFDPKALPRTDLGLEGTPWFMAPEVLSSQVVPASDVWAAGVMAHQLLSGFLPFDDARNPRAPALSKIWRAILSDDPGMTGPAWCDISKDAKDFVQQLLAKDPSARPTAKAALQHPWLVGGVADRYSGRPLSHSVIQRVQRYAQKDTLKRTVFELIAQELLQLIPSLTSHSPHSSRHSNGWGM